VLNDFLLAVRCLLDISNAFKLAYFLLIIYKASNNLYVLILYIVDPTSLGHPRELQLSHPDSDILNFAHCPPRLITRSLQLPSRATVATSESPVRSQNTGSVSAHIPHAEKARCFR
jgi:hypothetical protein